MCYKRRLCVNQDSSSRICDKSEWAGMKQRDKGKISAIRQDSLGKLPKSSVFPSEYRCTTKRILNSFSEGTLRILLCLRKSEHGYKSQIYRSSSHFDSYLEKVYCNRAGATPTNVSWLAFVCHLANTAHDHVLPIKIISTEWPSHLRNR